MRDRIKDALRASIDTEDAAVEKRLATGGDKRKRAVKQAVKAARRQAEEATTTVDAAKPLEVTLSSDEAAALKRLRSQLRDQGHGVSKGELIRIAVALLAEQSDETVATLLAALPKLAPH
ncbi:hypothetical protein G3580_09755 [Nitrogeniibacter mangrovi]|uniref:Uncharacterized protein n=1 Tax=Nitrogeniibacter mangrovi TaxID=2016596 RepID=A0A6C1B551_9RHOO|nr:hypothetical protein [Nitrogeniibacter mangrovi]QID17898.1 hypothetical protein G3580_09755 [Nitrogeniibacter mangrovi]